MSFDPFEKSDYQGHRIELYMIGEMMAGNTLFLTNHDQNIDVTMIVGVKTFVSVPIDRGSISDDGDISTRVNLDLTIARGLPFETNLRNSAGRLMRVFYLDVNDPDGQMLSVWAGVTRAVVLREDELIITADKVIKKSEIMGCHRRVNRGRCANILYDQLCRAEKVFWNATIAEKITPSTIRISGPAASRPSGHFNGGSFIVPSLGTLSITGHTGDVVTLLKPLPTTIAVGSSVQMIPGCDLTYTTCNDRFDNTLNYNGFDFIPNKAGPFEGGGLM